MPITRSGRQTKGRRSSRHREEASRATANVLRRFLQCTVTGSSLGLPHTEDVPYFESPNCRRSADPSPPSIGQVLTEPSSAKHCSQLYSRLHNSVNTEIFFFGRDVTSHLIKHSFPLLSPDDTAQPRALFFRFTTDINVFDICLLNHGWSAGAFCKRITYFTMFSEIVHDFL